MLEYKGILRREQDMAGKWRILADCGDENISLKFQAQPNDAMVAAACAPIIDRRNAEITAEIAAKQTTDAAARETAKQTYIALLAGLGLASNASDEDVADALFEAKGHQTFPVTIKGKVRHLEPHEYAQLIQVALRNYERRGGNLFDLQNT